MTHSRDDSLFATFRELNEMTHYVQPYTQYLILNLENKYIY